MNRYKSSAELKDLAKEKLSGRYLTAISAFVLIECISILVNALIVTTFPTDTVTQYIIYLVVTGASSVFLGIFQTGMSLLFLNITCGRNYRLEDLFYGFTNSPSRTLTISLASYLVNLVCLMPAQIFGTLFMNTVSTTYMMLMLVTTGIGLLIYVPVSLGISQSYFLLLDFPNYTGKQALAASWKVMKGHKGRLFYMTASFIPLMFVASLSIIGLLWFAPYMKMTYTLFFLDIMNPEKAETH